MESWNRKLWLWAFEIVIPLSTLASACPPPSSLARKNIVESWKSTDSRREGTTLMKQKTRTPSFWGSHLPFNPCLDFGGSCKSWYKKRRTSHQLHQHDNWCFFHLWDHPAAVIFSAFSPPSLTTYLSEFWHNPVQSCEEKNFANAFKYSETLWSMLLNYTTGFNKFIQERCPPHCRSIKKYRWEIQLKTQLRSTTFC